MLAQSDSRKVLIVEDEALIAILIEDMLTELGFVTIGPAARLDRALDLARAEAFDLAILDVNLGNERSFPVADVLRERGIPFLFATGYGSNGLDARFQQSVTLKKPFVLAQLRQAINHVLVAGT